MILADDLMVLCAFRYCLGRMTYAVSVCVDWLLRNWGGLTRHTKELIIEEIHTGFRDGYFGMDIEKEQWQRILDRAKEEDKG